MSKKRGPSEEDITLFQRAVKGTKPLSQQKIRLIAPTAKSKPAKKTHLKNDPPNQSETQVSPVRGEEPLSYKHAGIQNQLLNKLSKGQFPIDAILDLHGLSIRQAERAIDDFFQKCRHNSVRVALIIHGKGHHSEIPILKNEVNHWLRQLDIVLAFCSASPKHGGRGAIYVLLRGEES